MRLAFSETSIRRTVRRIERRTAIVKTAFEKRHGNAPTPYQDDEQLDKYIEREGSIVRYRWREPLPSDQPRPKNTLVLLSGWTCHPCMYTPIIPMLNRNHAILNIENKGHWKSTMGKSNDRTYLSDMAMDTHAALTRHDDNKVVLVGHSMGGLVSLKFHSMFPDQVAGVVMICAPYKNPLETWMFGNDPIVNVALKLLSHSIELNGPIIDAVKRNFFAKSFIMQELGRIIVEGIGNTEINGSFEKLFDKFMRTNSEAFAIAFRAMLRENEDGLDQLKESGLPVLVITGQNDVIVSSRAWAKIIHQLPNAKLVTLPVGHLPTMEAPEETIRLIDEFARGCKF
ncbi:MAG: alpha/beta hydrolase [Candidatus Micrarchaeota archaeon]|nr:alpha/beta hydrolase [Candidatus Micrarchaeota archaeon]